MKIEEFVSQSEGEWHSMRSGHSLAFKHFEEIVSNIKIEILSTNDHRVLELIQNINQDTNKVISPFRMEWKAESNWGGNKSENNTSGCSILIPIENSSNGGIILRSIGYAEQIKAIANYHFLSDGTFFLSTHYSTSIAEERIWFVSKNVRCRSSLIRSKDSSAILQISHASEVRRLSLKNGNRN